MNDLISVAIIVAFFMLCVGFVRLCDSVVGRQAPQAHESSLEEEADEVAA